MRAKMILTVVGVAASVVLVGSLIAVAASQRSPEPLTLTVIEHATTDTVIDVGDLGDSTGDLLTFHNKLFNGKNTEIVGHNQGDCVRIKPGVGTWECRWTNFLRGGHIMVEGPFFDAHNSALAITGGTGIFANARGMMVLKSRAGGTEFVFEFHLIA